MLLCEAVEEDFYSASTPLILRVVLMYVVSLFTRVHGRVSIFTVGFNQNNNNNMDPEMEDKTLELMVREDQQIRHCMNI